MKGIVFILFDRKFKIFLTKLNEWIDSIQNYFLIL